MQFTKLAALALTVSLGANAAHAEVGGSKLSTLAGLSVIGGSMLLIASPFIVIDRAVTASTVNGNHMELHVSNDQGVKETIHVPKDVCDRANLQPGDKLTVTPNATGALLSKEDKPVAYLVNPDNARLTRNHALAR